jgi:hypothetical protein
MFRLNLKDFFQLETKSDERGNEGLYNTFMENFPMIQEIICIGIP